MYNDFVTIWFSSGFLQFKQFLSLNKKERKPWKHLEPQFEQSCCSQKQKPDKLSLFWLEMKINKLDVGQYVSHG